METKAADTLLSGEPGSLNMCRPQGQRSMANETLGLRLPGPAFDQLREWFAVTVGPLVAKYPLARYPRRDWIIDPVRDQNPPGTCATPETLCGARRAGGRGGSKKFPVRIRCGSQNPVAPFENEPEAKSPRARRWGNSVLW